VTELTREDGDEQRICARCWTRSCILSGPAVSGGCCRRSFRRVARSTVISGALHEGIWHCIWMILLMQSREQAGKVPTLEITQCLPPRPKLQEPSPNGPKFATEPSRLV